MGFGGKPDTVFGVSPTNAPRFSLEKIGPLLDAAHERLDGVVFKNLGWPEIREIFNSFIIHDGRLTYTISKEKTKKRPSLSSQIIRPRPGCGESLPTRARSDTAQTQLEVAED